MSPKRPGGRLRARPLHFIWIADSSGSMSENGKIQSLNEAIREATPHMIEVANKNPNAEIYIRCLQFSHGARWHIEKPQLLDEKFQWIDLEADPLEEVTINTDVIFLVDTSGSMNQEIKAIRESCVKFAETIIQKGANVRLGAIGFAIGGASRPLKDVEVIDLETYTIGIWPLESPEKFKEKIQTLRLRSLGGRGCYLADNDTRDIFPHVVRSFGNTENKKVLVIISDEMGSTEGVASVSRRLNNAQISTYLMGLADPFGAHQALARQTSGVFWDIRKIRRQFGFDQLLDNVAETVVREIVRTREDGVKTLGTDMGEAMRVLATVMRIPPMEPRAYPPVLVLISDGHPSDDFAAGLAELLKNPWAERAVRLAIGIGDDADFNTLRAFIGEHGDGPYRANNAEMLANQIQWASTAVLGAVSMQPSHAKDSSYAGKYTRYPRYVDDTKFNKTTF